MTTITETKATEPGAAPDPSLQWWGHSKEHGWLVLDRTIAGNGPGKGKNLLFLRCKDTKVIPVLREKWRLPAYEFAPNYLARLSQLESGGARDTLNALQARWTEFEPEIQRQCAEILQDSAPAPAPAPAVS